MPPNRSVASFFAVGGLFLVVPLLLILFWNASGCLSSSPEFASPFGSAGYCPTASTVKALVSFLPFLMVAGGVLIGYNLKRISDSYVPPKEGEDEEEEEEGLEEGTTEEIDLNKDGQRSRGD